MATDEEERLIEKLRKVEALFVRSTIHRGDADPEEKPEAKPPPRSKQGTLSFE